MESQVIKRFPQLRGDLQALYAAYYIAELLSQWTEDYDPHPVLFDEALETLQELGSKDTSGEQRATAVRLARFELIMLRELGYGPVLEHCAACGRKISGPKLAFSVSAGGVLCPTCQTGHRDRRGLSVQAWEALQELGRSKEAWKKPWSPGVRAEIRRLLGDYITYLMGKPPRLLSYLGK
jgi:DNA repair protein RecO (recombination protein O)